MLGPIFGFLLAVYFLVGRWSMGRLNSAGDVDSIVNQPRYWIIAMLVPVVLLLRQGGTQRGPRSGPTPVDIAICLFLGYMLFTALWAPNSSLAFDKAAELSVILGVAVAIAASRTARAEPQVEGGFWWGLVLFGVTMAGLAILHSTSGRIHVPGGGPITFGRNMGLMGLGAVYLAGKHGIKARPFCAAAMVVAALMILLCGSRGALLSSGIGACVLLVTAREALSKKLALAAAVGLLGTAVLISTSTGRAALETFQDRIVKQTFERRHLSSRDDLWLDAVDWIQERPGFGWGLNGYRASSWNYPHNIFLEITVEGGLVGLLLFLNIARAWIVTARRHRYQVPRVALAALGLALTAAQTSGDLFDSRGVFLLLALSTPTAMPVIRVLRRRRAGPAGAVAARPAYPSGLANASVSCRPMVRIAGRN